VQGFVAFLLVGALLVARALAPEAQLEQFVGVVVGVVPVLVVHHDGLLEYALHVAALRPDDPARHLEVPLVLDLDVVSAGQLVLLGGAAALLAGAGLRAVAAAAPVVEEVLPVEAVDEDVHVGGDLGVDVVVAHPLHQDFEAAAADLGVAQHLVGDVGVDEGVEEDVGVLPVVAQDDLVDLAELLEDPPDVALVQLRPLRVGIAAAEGHRDADDGQVVAVAQPLASQLALDVAHEGLVI
jgi:hypothetical protein